MGQVDIKVEQISDAESRRGLWNYVQCEYQIPRKPPTLEKWPRLRSCQRCATIRIEGRRFCVMHAGNDLLARHIEAQA